MEEIKTYTLTQLNQAFEKHVMKHFSQRLFWISAEVVKVNHKNGHCYLELADSENGVTTARTLAMIWATTFQSIKTKIGQKEVESLLKSGNRVLLSVKIDFHSVYGLKLSVFDLDPSYSYGEIERQKQEVIKRLKQEGIFDLQQQVRLPTIIKRIALIGSPGTSGFRDFQNELLGKHDFNKFTIKEFPVSVQGDGAVDGIVKAIKEANTYDADVIVILRGGGSKMDLALFDDYKIAKEICHSRLPVLTGIGHETDEVVSDLVARAHFITPTAVARHIHYGIISFIEIMKDLRDRVSILSMDLLAQSKDDFTHYSNYLLHYSKELIHYWKVRFQDIGFEVSDKSKAVLYEGKDELSTMGYTLSALLQSLVKQEENKLQNTTENVLHNARYLIEREREVNVNAHVQSIDLYAQQLVHTEKINFNNLVELLTLLNPLKILASGYTISTINDEDLKNVEVKVGDIMKTLSSNYLISSEIKEIKKQHHGKE